MAGAMCTRSDKHWRHYFCVQSLTLWKISLFGKTICLEKSTFLEKINFLGKFWPSHDISRLLQLFNVNYIKNEQKCTLLFFDFLQDPHSNSSQFKTMFEESPFCSSSEYMDERRLRRFLWKSWKSSVKYLKYVT